MSVGRAGAKRVMLRSARASGRLASMRVAATGRALRPAQGPREGSRATLPRSWSGSSATSRRRVGGRPRPAPASRPRRSPDGARLDRLAGGWARRRLAPAPAPVGGVAGTCRYVLTVHDLSVEHQPGDFSALRPRSGTGRPPGAAGARRPARVIADSEADAARGDGALGPGPSPGDGGAWPLAAAPRRAERSPTGLPSRYLLFVGALEPRKGGDVLVDAHRLAQRSGPPRARVRRRRAARERSSGARRDRARDACPTTSWRRCTRTRAAPVLPSREEGFGFTPLESLARAPRRS